MKLITAVIKPFMLDRLTLALVKASVAGFTVTEVRGYGHGADEPDPLSPKIKVEIVVLPDDVDKVCELIFKTVSTHQEGDGIMFVTELEGVRNIRTGAKDHEALIIG